MNLVTVRELYRNRETYMDKEITIGGWVRSVRDSKAFGFIVVSDGSYFETLQVVYHDTMANFSEISKLNVGAAIIVKGTLVATPQAKQPFEIQATEDSCRGRLCSGVSASEKASHLRVPPHNPAFKSTHQHLPGCIPCSLPDRLCNSPVLPGARFRLRSHSADHRK